MEDSNQPMGVHRKVQGVGSCRVVAVRRIWDCPMMGTPSSSQLHNVGNRNEGTPRQEDEELLHEEQGHPQRNSHTREKGKCKKEEAAEKSCDILTPAPCTAHSFSERTDCHPQLWQGVRVTLWWHSEENTCLEWSKPGKGETVFSLNILMFVFFVSQYLIWN